MAEAAQLRFEHLFVRAERVTGQTAVVSPLPVRPTTGRLEAGDVVIDLDRERVERSGAVVRLTSRERDCIAIIVANRDRVISREAMMALVHADDPTVDIRSRAVDVHLRSARAKLGPSCSFEAVHGIGYRFVSDLDLGPARRGPCERADASKGAAPDERERGRAERQEWARRSRAAPPPAPTPALPTSVRRPTR
jgi:DNA-binding winged helix-turn-helix (wHTH) protein